jgi:hypothetical protein
MAVRVSRAGVLAALILCAGLAAACNRNAPKLTACVGDVPAVPRITDVAPPNCPK